MDCSKTEVFFKEWRRMCEHHTKNSTIGECLLRSEFGCGECYGVNAIKFALSGSLKEVQAVVQEWSDQHPIKTRLNVFLEAFPNAKIRTKGEEVRLEVCAKEVFGVDVLCLNNCYKCWNTPIEEGE